MSPFQLILNLISFEDLEQRLKVMNLFSIFSFVENGFFLYNIYWLQLPLPPLLQFLPITSFIQIYTLSISHQKGNSFLRDNNKNKIKQNKSQHGRVRQNKNQKKKSPRNSIRNRYRHTDTLLCTFKNPIKTQN